MKTKTKSRSKSRRSPSRLPRVSWSPTKLKAGGFTDASWRLAERDRVARANQERREVLALMADAGRIWS